MVFSSFTRRAAACLVATALTSLPEHSLVGRPVGTAPASALEVQSRSEQEVLERSLYSPSPDIQSSQQQVRTSKPQPTEQRLGGMLRTGQPTPTDAFV